VNDVLDNIRTSCRARLRLPSGAAALALLSRVTFLDEEAEFGLTACDDSGPGASLCAGTSFPWKLVIVAIAAVATRATFTVPCCEAREFRVRQDYGMPTVFRLSHRPMRPEDAGIHTCIRYAVRPIRRDGAFLLPRMAASLPSAETMQDSQLYLGSSKSRHACLSVCLFVSCHPPASIIAEACQRVAGT
jgi:hypothetical protein